MDRELSIQQETETAWANVRSGVPQGTVLGPLLFLAYINDLPTCTESPVRLFADDCILYRYIHSEQDTNTLQKDLDRLALGADLANGFQPDQMLCDEGIKENAFPNSFSRLLSERPCT